MADYNLDELRAALKGASYDEWAVGHVPPDKLRNVVEKALDGGLLDDAALGREHKAAMVALGNEIEALRAELERRREDAEIGERVRAAAERDGPERLILGLAIGHAQRGTHGVDFELVDVAAAAARALVAMKEGAK